MTSEALVVDVSREWATACDVQQRFMQGLDRGRDAGSCGRWAAIAMISRRSWTGAWR